MEKRKNFETTTRICGNIGAEDLFFFFWSSAFSFDPHSNKLLVPPCPLRIHIIKISRAPVPPSNSHDKNFSCPPKFISATPQSRYFGAGPALVLGLGLEHSSPWPQKGLSSEGLFLALGSDFFVFLVSSLVTSTPPLIND